MAHQFKSPYVCHIFVCTNDRGGEEKSCADYDSSFVSKSLKKEVSNRGWKKRVRVAPCGCVGQCEKGPVAVIYPQDIWFSGISADDLDMILSRVEGILKERSNDE